MRAITALSHDGHVDPELGAALTALTRLADDYRRAWRARDAGASEEEVAEILCGEVGW
jgi:hypothetical protein